MVIANRRLTRQRRWPKSNYGADCMIVGPPAVRDRFATDIIIMARHYRPLDP